MDQLKDAMIDLLQNAPEHTKADKQQLNRILQLSYARNPQQALHIFQKYFVLEFNGLRLDFEKTRNFEKTRIMKILQILEELCAEHPALGAAELVAGKELVERSHYNQFVSKKSTVPTSKRVQSTSTVRISKRVQSTSSEKPVSKKARRLKCGNCGNMGHTKRSKKCPNYCKVSDASKRSSSSSSSSNSVPVVSSPSSNSVASEGGPPDVRRSTRRQVEDDSESYVFSNDATLFNELQRVDIIEVHLKEGIVWPEDATREKTEAFLSKVGYDNYTPREPSHFFFEEFEDVQISDGEASDGEASDGEDVPVILIKFGLISPDSEDGNIEPVFTINTKYIEWKYVPTKDDESDDVQDPRWQGLLDKLHTYGNNMGLGKAERGGFEDDLANIVAAESVLERLEDAIPTDAYLTALDTALIAVGRERVLDNISQNQETNGYVMVRDDKVYVEDFDPEVQLGNAALKVKWNEWKTAISSSIWNSEWQYVAGQNNEEQENIRTWALLVAAEQLPAVEYTGNIEEADNEDDPPVRITSQDGRKIEIWFEGFDDKYEAMVIRNDTSVDPIVIECAYIDPSVEVTLQNSLYTITKIPWGDEFRYRVEGVEGVEAPSGYLEWSEVSDFLLAKNATPDDLEYARVDTESPMADNANFKLDFENNSCYNDAGIFTMTKFNLFPLGDSDDHAIDAKQEAIKDQAAALKDEEDEEEDIDEDDDPEEDDSILNATELIMNNERSSYRATERRGPLPWQYKVNGQWVRGNLLEPYVEEEDFEEEGSNDETVKRREPAKKFDPDARYKYIGLDYKQEDAVLHKNDVVVLVPRPGSDDKTPYLMDTDFYWNRYVEDRRRQLRPSMYEVKSVHVAQYEITRNKNGKYSVFVGGAGADVQQFIRQNLTLDGVFEFLENESKSCPQCGRRYRNSYNKICKVKMGTDKSCGYNFAGGESKEQTDKDDLKTAYERFTIYENFLKGILDTDGFEADIDAQLKSDGLLPVETLDVKKTISDGNKEATIKDLMLATELVSVRKTKLGPNEPNTIFQDIDLIFFDVVSSGGGGGSKSKVNNGDFNPDDESDESGKEDD